MQKYLFSAIFLAFLMLPSESLALVRINEIAWMGSRASSADEWIELYNDGAEAVDLTSYKISAEKGEPYILLSGSIAQSGYYLIERTDDGAVPGIVADLTSSFSGGLSNEGETLLLADASGNVIDRVVGGKNWVNIGGNNETKETAQRTQNSWVTGIPTPRAENVAEAGEVLGASSQTSAATSLIIEDTEKHGFVGIPMLFHGIDSLGTSTSPHGVIQEWNFGDGSVGKGNEVSHTYKFGGDYVATRDVGVGTAHKISRFSVSVTELLLRINEVSSGEAGFLSMVNRGNREVDLSGFIVKESTSGKEFIFPSHSMILPGKTFILPNEVSALPLMGRGVLISSPDGTLIDKWEPKSGSVSSGSSSKTTEAESVSHPLLVGEKLQEVIAIDKLEATSSVASVLWSRSGEVSGFPFGSSTKWLLAIVTIFLALAAVTIISVSKIEATSPANDFAIIEDIIEGANDDD